MTDRFDVRPLLIGHFRVMRDLSTAERKHGDVLARVITLAVPTGVGFAVYQLDGRLAAPTGVLAGVALLAGVFLSAFTHVAGLRQKLADREDLYPDVDRPIRDHLDESATHLLMAALLAGVTSVLLVIGMNFADKNGAIGGVMGAVVSFSATYVGVLFFMSIPRLYYAYTQQFRVPAKMHG